VTGLDLNGEALNVGRLRRCARDRHVPKNSHTMSGGLPRPRPSARFPAQSFCCSPRTPRTPRASCDRAGCPRAPQQPQAPRWTRRARRSRRHAKKSNSMSRGSARPRPTALFLSQSFCSWLFLVVLRVASRTPRPSREPAGRPMVQRSPRAPQFTRRSRRPAKNRRPWTR